MYWIDDPNGATEPPAPPADTGKQTWFQEEDAVAGIPKVYVRAWWLNMLGRELLNIVQTAGIAPSKTIMTQVLSALQQLFAPIDEVERAEAAEAALYNEIEAETTRAESVEAQKAPLTSPVFAGDPKTPTPPAGDASGQIANTGWVSAGYLALTGGTITGGVEITGGASIGVSGQVNATAAICQNGIWSGNTTTGYNPIFSQLTGVFLSQGLYGFNGANAAAYLGTGAAGGHIVEFYSSRGGVIGSIGNNADSGVAFNTTSDPRLKTDVETLSGEAALGVVEQLRPIAFAWRDRPEAGRVAGFLSTEFGTVLPAAVTGAPDATRPLERVRRQATEDAPAEIEIEQQILPQMIDQTRTIPYLVAAVGHLAAQLRDTRAALAALQAGGS